MRNRIFIGAALAALVALPIVAHAAATVQADQQAAWRGMATEQDRARIRGWRSTWVAGLKEARAQHQAEIVREGALLDPDAALLRPELPAGEYRCRTIKIGGQSEAMLDWVEYPGFRCQVGADENGLSFVRLGGSQRPVGRFYADGPRRMIFLGTLQLGDERQLRPYGSDAQRDMAGILERVGEGRWRLVFPRPAFESIIDVIELVPAS